MNHSQLGKHRLEPKWQIPLGQLHRVLNTHSVPIELLDWLLDPGSLTSRLLHYCPDNFQVRPRAQYWSRPMLNEAQALGVNPQHICFIREVHLLCGKQPWVFARTVIPVTSLSGPRRRLARLGKKPLGAVLFADPHMRRSGIEIARLLPFHTLYQHAVEPLNSRPEEIWGRRSAFYLNDRPLLVNEIFLPGIDSAHGT